MAGNFVAGETKIRPGVYFRTTKAGPEPLAGAINGIVAVALKANWGPLGQVVALSSPAEIYDNFGDDAGTGSNTALINKIFDGGASTVKVVRVGSGGTKAAITLQDDATSPENVVTLTAKHAGARALSVTVRDNLGDPTGKRDLVIYSGTKELNKFTFTKGTGEPASVVAAINANPASVVTAALVAPGSGELAALSQKAFTTAGVSPTVTTSDYSALVALSGFVDVVCIDSNIRKIRYLEKLHQPRNGRRIDGHGDRSRTAHREPCDQATARCSVQQRPSSSVNGFYAADGTCTMDSSRRRDWWHGGSHQQQV